MPTMRYRRHARLGVTLIEVVVAILVATVGVLSLELTAATSLRSLADSGRSARATDLARSRMELLRNAPCSAGSGADSAAEVTVAWQRSDAGNGLAALRLSVRAGAGQGRRDETYSALVPCR